DSLASRISLVSPPRSIGEAAGPTLGVFQLQAARARETMQIGEVHVDRPVLTFRNRPGTVIGVPLLEQLVLTLDQRHQRLRVVAADTNPITIAAQPWETAQTGERSSGAAQPAREGPPPPPASSGQRTMGFNLAGVPGGALAVRNVVAGSSAERVGLKEGDQLIEFDGTRSSDMNPTVFRAAAARGKPVRVVIDRGGKRLELMIEPYVVP